MGTVQISNIYKFTLYSIALVAISLGTFITSAAYLTVGPLNSKAPDQIPFPADVSLMVEALSVDPISRTITMDWYPSFTDLDCTKAPVVTDILTSQSLLDTTSPSWTPQPPYLPLYTLNTTEYCLGLVAGFPLSFRTVTKLLTSSVKIPILPASGHSTLQNYPFDVYAAPFSFSTRNKETGAITALNISAAFGLVVNFEISLQRSFSYYDQIGNLKFSRLDIAFQVKRSKATKMFVVMVAITNWLTVIVFLIMCAATLVYHPHEIYSEMFVVPVGAVFAFTSIRANFPGAPAGFGTTLDLYSILPFISIMSFCSCWLLLLILYQRISETAVKQHLQGTLTVIESPLSAARLCMSQKEGEQKSDIEKNHQGTKEVGNKEALYAS